MWLYISRLLKRTLYLAPFSRNYTFKLQVTDFWPFTMTWGQIFYRSWKFQYATFYQTCIDTNSLSRTVCEIFHLTDFVPWPLTFEDHQRSNIYSYLESSCGINISYLCISTSCTIFEIFHITDFKYWPLAPRVTVGQNYLCPLIGRMLLPINLSSIALNSLSRLVSVIFACQISLDHGQIQTFDLLKVEVIE